ncbi:UDP-glucose 4-epimerase [Salipaludibacillus keqinensis]|uniref:UDP-glucose 4-epimerase n=1 Tax=Salipaludibacillus keqinensis TaxID=2045207 RepID=A0A323TER8_9BACI|nr:NAD-dependent epimerase/dehydratase family protein [Salipaludibacillus keqinensis]PYZ92554.1 UDP-glucose 4-epimerase [Salipaludibacillus keqinensis]
MEKTLVTGGAGFIGSHVVDQLVTLEKHVVILDNLSSGDLNNVNPSHLVTLIEGDVRNVEDVQGVFTEHPDIDSVVHLAAQSKVGPSLADPQMDLAINIQGTVNVLEAARKHDVTDVVYSSSAAVYGHVETLPVTEEAPTAPLSPYGVSKLSAEEYVKAYGKLYNFTVTALRFANVYGPRQSAATEAGVITIFIEQLLAGGQPTIQGDGKQTRDFVYVEDVADAVIRSLETGQRADVSPVYNVSSETETTVETLLRNLCKEVGEPFNPRYEEERAGDIKYSYLSNRKLSGTFDWTTKTRLGDGLKKTVEYYQSRS